VEPSVGGTTLDISAHDCSLKSLRLKFIFHVSSFCQLKFWALKFRINRPDWIEFENGGASLTRNFWMLHTCKMLRIYVSRVLLFGSKLHTWTRVTNFFCCIQHTKIGKLYQITRKHTKLPLNMGYGRKYIKWTKNKK
jgi:hypothetical protein